MEVRLKRAYEPTEPEDGYRVLIDRLWPRGVSRRQVKLGGWEKELAPSTLTLVYSARDTQHNDAVDRG